MIILILYILLKREEFKYIIKIGILKLIHKELCLEKLKFLNKKVENIFVKLKEKRKF